MKKTFLKKFTAIIVLVAVVAASLVGCSVIKYSEEADLGQVMIEIKASDVTVKVPFTADYKDPSGNTVYEVDEDPSSASFGQTTTQAVQAVMYDHAGNPIYKPAKEGEKIKYVKYIESGESAELTSTTEKSQASVSKDSGNYWINPETGKEYEFMNITVGGVAQWKSLHDTNTYVYGAAQASGASVVSNGTCQAFLPVMVYSASDPSKHQFDSYSYIPETTTYTTKADRFFKQELITQFVQNGKEYLDSGNTNIDGVFDRIVKEMYSDLIYRREIDIAIQEGRIDWGVTERNSVKKAVYSGIDSRLTSIYNEIAEKHDRSSTYSGEASTPTPTYNTAPEEGKAPEYLKDYKVWDISQEPERWLNCDSSADRNSLERAGLREFLQQLSDSIDETYSMTEEQGKKFAQELKEMQEEAKDNAKISDLYKKLYTYDVIQFLFGESPEASLKNSLLQAYIGKDVSITDADIENTYKDLLTTQKDKYSSSADDYITAAADSADKLLYFATDDVFWVKHILLPFSDEQTKDLETYKNNHNSLEVEAYRQQLAKSMVVYKHVDGENDTEHPMTLKDAYANIKSVMDAAYGDETAALNAFDGLIYDYNTDPGIFDSEMGYEVNLKSKEEGGEEEKYMIEFARESRELVKAYRAGKSLFEYKKDREAASDNVYKMNDFELEYIGKLNNTVKIGSISQPVITDYGVHILMLNFVPNAGDTRELGDYLTAAKKTQVRDAIMEDVSATVRANAAASWKNRTVNSYSDYVMYDTVGNTNGEGVIIAVYKNKFKAQLDEYEDTFTKQIAEERAQKEQEEKEKEENKEVKE